MPTTEKLFLIPLDWLDIMQEKHNKYKKIDYVIHSGKKRIYVGNLPQPFYKNICFEIAPDIHFFSLISVTSIALLKLHHEIRQTFTHISKCFAA